MPALALAGAGAAWAQYETQEVHDPRTGRLLGRAAAASVIVQFDPASSDARRGALHAALGSSEARNLGSPGLYEVLLPPGVAPDAALAHYSASPFVRAAHPNFIHHATKLPNDPLQAQQYALAHVDAFSAWEFEVGSSSPVTIAVMDTGVEATHPDLAAKYDAAVSRTFCTGVNCTPSPAADVFGHGTEAAGVAGAATDNGVGVAGISWGGKLASLKVLDDDGSGTDANIVAALNYAVTLATTTGRRTVVNMSLGSCPDPGNSSSCGACASGAGSITEAVTNALASGVVVVASAGNQTACTLGPGCNPFKNVVCPAKIPGVIAVGATDEAQNVASFSGQGPEMASQGVVAPGVNMRTTAIGGGYTGSATGTSFSAPLVSGLAALMLSAKPALLPAQVLANLRASSELIGPSTLGFAGVRPAGNSQGAGRVSAFKALRLTIRGTLADFEGKQKAIAFPNPFRVSRTGSVSITVPDDLAGAGAKIKIYAMDGTLVRTLTGAAWDGKNDKGTPAATGTYIFSVSTDKGRTSGKLTLVR